MAEELRRKEEEDKIREYLDQEAAQNDLVDPEPLASSSGTITNNHIPFVELGLTPFTPSKKHIEDRLDTIIFDKPMKTITQR